MAGRRSRKGTGIPTVALCLAAAAAFWVLLSHNAKEPELRVASQHALRTPQGQPQLVSIEPLPEMQGETCEWVPASSRASLLQERRAASSPAESSAENRPQDMDRAPVRTIRDPNPSYSAIAVEPASNMVVITDENLFQILEYNRLDNTPPAAKMTEPKRVIGGTNTKAEMMCGVYIDPKTLETYIINNDTQDWMAVFSKEAKGNVAPDRLLATPHGTFGIGVDESKQEMYLTVQHQNAVYVYRKMASGNEKPLRVLAGNDTQLEDPHGIAVDAKNNLLIVSNHGNVAYSGTGADAAPPLGSAEDGGSRNFRPGSGKFYPSSITIYPRDAKENTAPLRVIEGPRTRLNWPAQIAVDEERGEIYVANDMDHSIAVFKITDSGDVAPTRLIRGPKSEILNPTGITLDLKNKELWVANMGNHSATAYPLTANGDAAPLRKIRGGPADEPALMIGNPGAVGYDSKREEILVPN